MRPALSFLFLFLLPVAVLADDLEDCNALREQIAEEKLNYEYQESLAEAMRVVALVARGEAMDARDGCSDPSALAIGDFFVADADSQFGHQNSPPLSGSGDHHYNARTPHETAADVNNSAGDVLYNAGDYFAAKSKYQNALSSYQSAAGECESAVSHYDYATGAYVNARDEYQSGGAPL